MSDVQDEARSYDAVPYESLPLRVTHPDSIVVQCRLKGLDAPDPRRARVLEIGCATGGNLLPMAVALPEATFVGVDISPEQINTGQRVQKELGIRNVELRAESITDARFAPGSFDYVLCHGVWSWVPEVVQRSILAVCARVLSPDGVAYVSYNTYPGWHLRGMVRDMLLWRTRGIDDPGERIRTSREFVAFLHENARDRDTAFAKFLGEEAQLLDKASDTYVFHEHLEANNRPVWFHEFVAAAAGHGLQFVGEALPEDALALEPQVESRLAGLSSDPLAREQYVDFLHNRTFRRSLLCRTEARIDRSPRPDPITSLWLGSPLRPEQGSVDGTSDAVETFVGPGALRLSVGHPWLKTAFSLLGQRWPELTPYADLAAEIDRRRGVAPAPDEANELLAALRHCHAGGVLKLENRQSIAVRTPGVRPFASPLARWMARSTARVCSLRHELVELRDVDRQVLLLLDGTRDRGALAVALRRLAAEAGLRFPNGIDVAVTESLAILGMAAMLMPGAG